MPNRTIPEPSADELEIAETAIMMQAKVYDLDITDPKFLAFVKQQTNVRANLMAANRWLCNIINDRTFFNDTSD